MASELHDFQNDELKGSPTSPRRLRASSGSWMVRPARSGRGSSTRGWMCCTAAASTMETLRAPAEQT
eukprot:5021026-Alexandrium_andersonii.AAC.1